MPDLAPFQWLLGLLSAFFVGLAKTGVPGLGIVVVPMMVLAVGDAKLSAAWLLPILCTADVFAIIYWRRHASARKLFHLVPWVAAGILAGAAALSFSERVLRPTIGAIVILMLLVYLYRQHRPAKTGAEAPAAPYGVAAGFATTVANAAGPVMNLYLLSKKLPKEEFVATGAWFFFFVNLSKVPVYALHGLFSRPSLAFDVAMIPAVMVGAVTGRWLIGRIPSRIFEVLVVTLTAVSTLLLFR